MLPGEDSVATHPPRPAQKPGGFLVRPQALGTQAAEWVRARLEWEEDFDVPARPPVPLLPMVLFSLVGMGSKWPARGPPGLIGSSWRWHWGQEGLGVRLCSVDVRCRG